MLTYSVGLTDGGLGGGQRSVLRHRQHQPVQWAGWSQKRLHFRKGKSRAKRVNILRLRREANKSGYEYLEYQQAQPG